MQYEIGAIVEGRVTSITNFGAFVELADQKTGMIHVSEVSQTFVRDIHDFLKENQTVKVKIINIDQNGRISLSIKRLEPAPAPQPQQQNNNRPFNNNGGNRPQSGAPRGPRPQSAPRYDWVKRPQTEPASFEDMLNRFKQDSDERMSDIKRNSDAKRGGRGGGRNSGGRP